MNKRGDTRGCSIQCIAARPPSSMHTTDECHEAGGEKETRACYDGRMAQEWWWWWWCSVLWQRGEERAMEKGRKATVSWRLIVSAHKHKAAPHSTARKDSSYFDGRILLFAPGALVLFLISSSHPPLRPHALLLWLFGPPVFFVFIVVPFISQAKKDKGANENNARTRTPSGWRTLKELHMAARPSCGHTQLTARHGKP